MFEDWLFLKTEFFGNTSGQYLISVGIFIAVILVLIILEKFVIRRIRAWTAKTKNQIDDFIFATVDKTIYPLLYLGAFYFAVDQLSLEPDIHRLVVSLCIAVATVQSTRFVIYLMTYFLERTWLLKDAEETGRKISRSILTILKIGIWAIAIIFVLDNFGFNIGAIIAGLGVGGIAIALASQHILGDFFDYLVIFFDKPFEVGDFIIFGDYLGTIEKVGIKTTHIRSLGGEQIILGNSELTKSIVRNYKRMERRRVVFGLGVVYQTPLEQMKKIPSIIRSTVESIDDTIFDRAHFKEYGDFSLNLEIVYYVIGNDYNKYMDIQQKINLEIMQKFKAEGIEFAYPTQTLFMEKV